MQVGLDLNSVKIAPETACVYKQDKYYTFVNNIYGSIKYSIAQFFNNCDLGFIN